MESQIIRQERIFFGKHDAIRMNAAVIGIFFGLFSSINHGVFETLQGNKATHGTLINAIGEAQRFWPEGTEPAFTLIPNYLLTGIAAILVGAAIIAWSIWYLPSRHGRTVFLGLFILSFLVGGGIGQAFFFIPAWAFATQMGKPLTGWKRILPRRAWPFLSRLWIFTLVLATAAMLVGLEMAIFGYFPGIQNLEALTNINMMFVFGAAILYILSFVAGIGHNLLQQALRSSNEPQKLTAKGEIS